MPSYLPTPGTINKVSVAGNVLSVATFHWGGTIKVLDCPSFTGGNYMETVGGKKRLSITMSGTWNQAFNPFVNGVYLGAVCNVTLWTIDPAQFASTDYCLISEFDVDSDCDGLATYSMTIVGTWTFNDFSNTNA